jgi:hypothetical protein
MNGIFVYRKFQFWYILEGLGMEIFCIFHWNYAFFQLSVIYLCIVPNLVYFVAVCGAFFPFWYTASRKIWQPWAKCQKATVAIDVGVSGVSRLAGAREAAGRVGAESVGAALAVRAEALVAFVNVWKEAGTWGHSVTRKRSMLWFSKPKKIGDFYKNDNNNFREDWSKSPNIVIITLTP